MISLSTITSYTGANGVLLDAQQTGLKTVGFVHRLKSFFGIGDAREKNRATLNALKAAVLTDPRFNTPDLQAERERLFKNASGASCSRWGSLPTEATSRCWTGAWTFTWPPFFLLLA